MLSLPFSRISISLLIANIFFALLLIFVVFFLGLRIVQGVDDSQVSHLPGLAPLSDHELSEISAYGLMFPWDLLPGINDNEIKPMSEQLQLIMTRLDFLDSDTQVIGVSYGDQSQGNNIILNTTVGIKEYPLPEHIDRIVFENIRIRSDADRISSSLGTVTIENINFQDLNVVVTLD